MDSKLEQAFNRLKSWPTAVSVADTSKKDDPLIYVNNAFTELTGYEAEECIGRNCRFLQGYETDQDAIAKLRNAVDKRHHFTVCLFNYRKNGPPFHNLLIVTPVDLDESNHLILGCQYEIHQAIGDEELAAQLSNVRGAFDEIEKPQDRRGQLFLNSIEVRTTATRMVVDSYMYRAPTLAAR